MTTTSVIKKRKIVDSSGECDVVVVVDVNSSKKLKQEEQKQSQLATAATPQSVDNTLKNKRLNYEFFDQDCVDLSKALLGKIIVRRVVDDVNKNSYRLLRARIVETEAYCGIDDPAAHSYGNKRTERTTAMFMKPGTCYVYNIYGIHCCVNISSKGDGAAVLLRALEPLDGIDIMKKYRKLSDNKKFKVKDLTSGPSKLCQSLNITKPLFNQVDLCANDDLWLENPPSDESNVTVAAASVSDSIASTSTISSCSTSSSSSSIEIVSSKRINIDYAGDDACNKLYRFYIKNNTFVSVIDK